MLILKSLLFFKKQINIFEKDTRGIMKQWFGLMEKFLEMGSFFSKLTSGSVE